MEVQIKELKAQLAERDKSLEWQQNRINELTKQLHAKIEDSPLFQAQVDSYKTIEVELELANRKITRLQKIITEQAGQIEDLTNKLASVTNTAIPVAHKRGAKPKVDLETRQYARELYKLGRSIRTIAVAIGISSTQTHAIIHEPDIPGRWFITDSSNSKTYFNSYHEAYRSGHKPHFEVAGQDTDL